MISLFDKGGTQEPPSFGLFASSLLHIAAVTLLVFGVTHNPLIIEAATSSYKAQLVDIHAPTSQSEGMSLLPSDLAKEPPREGQANEAKTATSKPVPPEEMGKGASQQTLLRPTNVQDALSERIPLPTLLMISKTNVVLDRVSPPKQMPAVVNASPQLQIPIDEQVADFVVPASPIPNHSLPIAASTTSPIAIPDAKAGNRVPTTPSDSDSAARSANAVSISDTHLNNGTTVLPMTNQVAGAGHSGIGTGKVQGTSGAAMSGAGSGSGGGGTRHVTLPKDGHFGIVVVGASLEELYPQTTEIWGNRLAYTVYLNLGTTKRWILQYSPLSGANAASNGQAKHLEAPWPTDVLVPNLDGAVNADVLLVHGYLNSSGRFENLAVAFPPGFPLSQFVLDSLRQWQFRPAKQDGNTTGVEILLIVP